MMHMLDWLRLLEAHQFSVFKLLQGILGFFSHPRTSAASRIFAARCVQVIEWIIVIWGSTFQVLSMPILGGAAHFVIHAFMGFFQKPWSDVVGSPKKKQGSRVPYDTHPRINRSFTGNHGLYMSLPSNICGKTAGFPSNSGKGWVLVPGSWVDLLIWAASQAARRAGHVVLFVRRGEGAQTRSTEGVGPESQALRKNWGKSMWRITRNTMCYVKTYMPRYKMGYRKLCNIM